MTSRGAYYRNIDIGRVTITVKKEEVERLSELLGGLADGKQFYEGWISDENPSPSLIGFIIGIDGSSISADFSNVPYYYRDYTSREDYYTMILSYVVTRDPSFSSSRGGYIWWFDAQKLKTFIRLLNGLAEILSRLPPGTVYAPPPSPHVPEDVPVVLRDYLEDLERWALANKKDASRDAIAFWTLKLPAIFVSASAGIWAYFQLPTVSVICGAIASFCIIIDGIYPRGMLRNTHLRAYHDIRILMNQIINKYRIHSTRTTAEDTSYRLIEEAEAEYQKIASYIRDAETALTDKLQSK